MDWHIGCSGFSYKEWKNVFYPKGLSPREWFGYYCSKFSTIELNVTFYRFPRVEVLEKWYERSPEHFLFAVKVPRLITHMKQLRDCSQMISDVYTTCKTGLREKLGPFLFQFPAAFSFTDERLNLLISSLNHEMVNIVEFRHVSWWQQKVYDELKRYKICFCSISHPDLPDSVIATGNFIYYRFHGVPQLYYSKYPEASLENIARTIESRSGIEHVYCYFNNTAAVGAIENAIWLENFVSAEYENI
jgi:uncharacterized protein YecE (DUF72 family)